MPADYKSLKITRPNPSGTLKEELLQVYAPAAGPTLVGGIDKYTTSLDPIHILVEGDPLTLRFANANTMPATITINAGTPIAIVKFDGTPVASGDIKTDMIATLLFDGVSFRMPAGGGGGSGSSAFNDITSGTNTTALMVVDSGASLTVTGTGVIEANELKTNTATPVVVDGSAPTHEGQILISQPGNASAAWADPFVQGVYDPLTSADIGGISGGPIKPILIGGRSPDGLLRDVANDLDGFLFTRDSSASTLGDLVSSKRYNQIEINFSEGFDANLITNSASGGGTHTTSAGAAFYTTSSAGTADAKGVSIGALSYRPGHEWYAYFTAAFTTPTDSVNTNFQRIGPFSATDGFYIGYEKNVFKFSHRQNSSDTGVAKASWNGDQCTGAISSTFTLLGSPITIDFTQLNVYRIHGAWFGAAPVILEVFSPDGIWVKLHTYHFPNSLLTPYTYTTNWNLQVEVSKTTSNATDLQITTACWALGTCDDEFLLKDTLTDYTLASVTRSVIAGKKESGAYGNVGLSNEDALNMSGSGSAHVAAATWTGATPGNTALLMVNNSFAYNTVAVQLTGSGTISTGKVTFEVSADNTNWVGLVGINVGTGAAMPTAEFTLVTGTTALLFNITGFNYFRARLSTTITGAGGTVEISYNVQGLASPNVSTTITTGAITVDSNQGTPNSIGNAWPVYVTDNASHALTVNSSTPVGKYALDQNIVSILGTAPTTAGKLDVKADIVSILGTAPTTAGKLDILTLADTAISGTTAPSKGLLILGKTADVTPVYDPIPLAAGGGSVVISGTVAVSSVGQGTAAASTAGWPVISGNVAAVTAAWTSATADSTALPIATVGYEQVAISINPTGGTITGGTIIFEVSDDGGTTWYQASAAEITGFIVDQSYALTASQQAWHMFVGGFTNARVRLHPQITGSGTINLRMQSSAFPSRSALTVGQATAANLNATVVPPSSTTASSTTSTAVATASVQVLAANASRKEVIISNVGATVIYLGLGATPTTTAYHVALSGCTNPHDGTGSVYVSDIWKGVINAISSGSAGIVVSAELT